MPSLTEMFKNLGAPLANQRWAWGAERESDGAIFLRVWQDECGKLNGKRAVRVTANDFFKNNQNNLGYAERAKHVSLIRSGRPVYLVMCIAKDSAAVPREIAGFDDKDVFVGGALMDHDGETWIELAARKPAREVRSSNSTDRTRD